MSTLFENIVIPIKVGDTVLGGKFKNKRIVVKDIGKNEKGDITINGRPLLKYRMVVDELVQVDLDPINEAKADITIGGKEYKLIKKGSKITLINTKLSADKYIFRSDKEFKEWADDQVEPIGGTQSSNFGINEEIDGLKNAKKLLKDPHTIKDIEYRKTRSRGDKFVKIIYTKDYVPGKMMDTGPHFVSVFYDDEKELQKIGKALKLKLKESVNEGRPFPMATPNEVTYVEFKKYAYRKRGMFKKELLKAKGDSSRMFQILSGLWYSWAKKNAPSFTRITNTLKFGRALMVMMVKDNLVFDRDNWKKTNKITKIQEIFYDNLGNPCSGNVTMDGRCIADEVDDRPLEEGVGLNKSLHKGIGPDGGDDLHEVGVFPVTNYISGIIPQGRLDTNTPENKKKSIKLVKDLTNTLNKFWKEHDIPFRIK